MSDGAIKPARAESTQRAEPQQKAEKVQNKPSQEQNESRSHVDDNADVRQLRGESSVDTGNTSRSVVSSPDTQTRTYATKDDANRDYKELQEKIAPKWPQAANSTFANLVKNPEATDEYKAEMARQVATAPRQNLSLTTLSQLPAEERQGVVGALKAAHQSGVLDRNMIAAANPPGPGNSPTHVSGLWDEATRPAPRAAAAQPELPGNGIDEADSVTKIFNAGNKALEWALEKGGESLGLTAAELDAAKGFVKGISNAFTGVQSSISVAAAVKAFQEGNYTEGISKSLEAAGGFGELLAKATHGMATNPLLKGALGKLANIGGGLGTFAAGFVRTFFGEGGGKEVDATDRVVGGAKMLAGALQMAPNPGTQLGGTLLDLGVDIADDTGYARKFVEGTGDALNTLQQGIQGRQSELDAARAAGIDPNLDPRWANPT